MEKKLSRWDLLYWLPFIVGFIAFISYFKPRIEIILITLLGIFIFVFVIPWWAGYITKKKYRIKE